MASSPPPPSPLDGGIYTEYHQAPPSGGQESPRIRELEARNNVLQQTIAYLEQALAKSESSVEETISRLQKTQEELQSPSALPALPTINEDEHARTAEGDRGRGPLPTLQLATDGLLAHIRDLQRALESSESICESQAATIYQLRQENTMLRNRRSTQEGSGPVGQLGPREEGDNAMSAERAGRSLERRRSSRRLPMAKEMGVLQSPLDESPAPSSRHAIATHTAQPPQPAFTIPRDSYHTVTPPVTRTVMPPAQPMSAAPTQTQAVSRIILLPRPMLARSALMPRYAVRQQGDRPAVFVARSNIHPVQRLANWPPTVIHPNHRALIDQCSNPRGPMQRLMRRAPGNKKSC
ncbi:unnamed protein product [Vitrella brassicaformis CCMP3155]|uniref:Uncharacterized protein n=2 Tax=Vitrella brassicaformis TaxID=1169539 RepID=A0A0G4G3F3_VITBC|nr:unnamed protein product [Vitrella brassicaformis CCMP3155]|eukprot:CEM22481.1 unnamed protein product [Vitrella brassicaformis CCMP3155]